jgi:hypothetical protein
VASSAPLCTVRSHRLLRYVARPACGPARRRVGAPCGRQFRAVAGLALRLRKTQSLSRIPARRAARPSCGPAGTRPKGQSPRELGVSSARRRLVPANSPISQNRIDTFTCVFCMRRNRDQLLEGWLASREGPLSIPYWYTHGKSLIGHRLRIILSISPRRGASRHGSAPPAFRCHAGYELSQELFHRKKNEPSGRFSRCHVIYK